MNPDDLIKRFLTFSEKKLCPDLKQKILQAGSTVQSTLIDALRDKESWLETSPSAGYAPLHAVEILTEMQCPQAIEPILDALKELDSLELLFDQIMRHFPKFGLVALEPCLDFLSRETNEDVIESVVSLLSELGVKDERIFNHILDGYHTSSDPVMSFLAMSYYKDPRFLPILRNEMEEFDIEHESPLLPPTTLIEAADAYKRIAGFLPQDLQDLLDDTLNFHRLIQRNHLQKFHGISKKQKIGRNDFCNCGSGKKYKRCCLVLPDLD